MKQFRVVAETDRNYPMGLTIDGKRIHVSVKWPGLQSGVDGGAGGDGCI